MYIYIQNYAKDYEQKVLFYIVLKLSISIFIQVILIIYLPLKNNQNF